MKVSLLAILLLLCSLTGVSQSVPFERSAFRDREPELKEAVQNLNKGKNLMEQGELVYKQALPFLEKAQAFNPSNAELNYLIGLCLLTTTRQEDALKHFLKAKALDPAVDPRLNFQIANANHLNYNWDEAIKYYKIYLTEVDKKDAAEVAEANHRIFECENGKKLSADTVEVAITNLGTVNSPEGDYIPLLSADGKLLFFTSRREGTTGGGVDEYDGGNIEDIYISNKETNGWAKPKNIGTPVNSEAHDAAVGLSVDGHSVIIFRGDVNAGDLFLSTNNGFNWTKPESLGSMINSKDHESSACFAPDGRTLYFVSDRPGGVGGRDIYKSIWSEDKKAWQKAENLGPVINTIYDEEGVFMHPDGRTLYFSSRGHNTIGGYDIFYSVFDGKSWSTPLNMGMPINTPGDEVFFQVSADGRSAYYSSYRKEGLGEKDLYSIEFIQRKEPVSKMVLLTGKVVDSETGLPIAAVIEVIDLDDNSLVGKFNNDAKTGEYIISLPAGRNYGTVVTSKGYLFESENFDLSGDSSAYKEVSRNVKLLPLKPGNGIVLHNVFFETGIYNLKETSKNELLRISELLKIYPTLKVEIQGHTDNVGSEAFNMDLSQKRAKAVKDYLTNIGVRAEQLTTNGYGYAKPKESNDTPEGRAMNRRIEMVVISN